MTDDLARAEPTEPRSLVMGVWIDVYNKLRTWAASTNGAEGDAQVPKLTNAQAASVLRYVMKQAEDAKLDPELTAGWYTAARTLAGWRKDGDRFIVTAKHRNAMAPYATAVLVWQLAVNVAVELDNQKRPMVPPNPRPEDDYKVVLLKAWERMQAEAKRDGVKPAPALPTTATASPSPIVPASSGPNPLALLLLVFLLAEHT